MRSASVVAAAVSAAMGAFLIFSSAEKLANARGEAAVLEQRLAEAERYRVELEEKLSHEPDAEELERLARERLGLVMHGETVFYFIPNT